MIHSKFAPSVTNNPNYTKRKEVSQVDKSYSIHPPLDLSVLADTNHTRSFSMGAPLKGVYRHMLKPTEIPAEFPEINNPDRDFRVKKTSKIMNPSYNFISEVDESIYNQTNLEENDRYERAPEIGKHKISILAFN